MVDSDDDGSYEVVRNKKYVLEGNDKNNIESGRKEDEDELDDSDNQIYEKLPPHCGGNLMIKPKRTKVYHPARVVPPAECFGPCPKVISREDWGARLPKREPNHMMFRVRPAVFKKSDCYSCSDPFSCQKNVQLLQMYQLDYLGFTDIAYNFMIGEDGNVYEGRGWGKECEKARGFMGIGFLGYYTDEGKTRPSDEMLQLAYDLIMCGVRKGFLANPFTMWGDEQTPIEMMREYIENEEDVDYSTKVEDPGIY